MKVRNYSDSDYTELKDILKATELFVPEVDTRARFKQKIEEQENSIKVATDSGEVVGVVFITDDATNVLITRLAVIPERQGEGIGSRLLENAENFLEKRGTRISVAFAESSNEELKDWYREKGYEEKEDYSMMWKEF
jgi:ribosomal protein S18 acetylase RimI-like enzyme